MVTRGYGVLEEFLASLRAKKADSLIPEHLRSGKIVDIGCGTTPYFLANTTFSKKIGIDTVPAGWTDPILKFLAQIRLLSATEVFDHKDTYSKNDVVKHLVQAGFPLQGIEAGYFELGMNIWCAARKQS